MGSFHHVSLCAPLQWSHPTQAFPFYPSQRPRKISFSWRLFSSKRRRRTTTCSRTRSFSPGSRTWRRSWMRTGDEGQAWMGKGRGCSVCASPVPCPCLPQLRLSGMVAALPQGSSRPDRGTDRASVAAGSQLLPLCPQPHPVPPAGAPDSGPQLATLPGRSLRRRQCSP